MMASAIQETGNLDFLGVLMMLQKKLSKVDLELMVTMCWVIWHARNRFFLKKKLKSNPIQVMAKAKAVNKAFRRTKLLEMLNLEIMQKKKPKVWTLPPWGWVKINVDTATDTKRQCLGLEAIIRDSTGRCLVASIKTTKFWGDVSYAEAEVVEWGINITKEAGLQSIILEIDCHQVVELINNWENSLTEIYWIILEIQASKKNFKAFESKDAPRTCNECTYSLARIAMEKSETFV